MTLMPIRFRCAYCNQLMAISRRKEGTVVRCPKCAGEIIVPSLEGTPAAENEAEQAVDQPVADSNFADIEDLAATVKTPSNPGSPPREEPLPILLPQRRGVFIPLGVFWLLIAVGFLVVGLTFVIGLIVGRIR